MTTPTGTATTTTTRNASTASCTVAGRRSPISDATGVPLISEVPNSPRNSPSR